MLFVYGYTFLLARMLPVSELGEYFLMFTIINILGLASMVGLDLGVVRYVALYAGENRLGLARKTLRAGIVFGIPVALLFTAGLIIAAPYLGDQFFNGNEAAVFGLRIFALVIPFMVAARLFNATTQGMHQMKYQVLSRDVGEQIAKISISATVLVLGVGLIGVVWANLASVTIAAGMALVFALIVLSGPVENDDADARPAMDVLKYSYPLALANILIAVTLWIDTLMLGYLGTTEDVGFYGVALKIAQFGAKIIMAFIIVFMPVIADLWNRKKAEELKELYMTVSRWIFTLSFPIFLIIVLFSDAIMRIFGSGFVAGSGALVILAAGQMITATTGAAGLMILMSGHSKLELFNVVMNLTVNVVLCLLLIPDYGVLGAAIAHMAALAVVNTLRVMEVWFFMHIFAYNLSYLKPVLSGLAGGIVALVIGRFVIDSVSLVQLALLACLLLVLYIVAIVAMGLEDQDKAILRRVKSSLTGAKAA